MPLGRQPIPPFFPHPHRYEHCLFVPTSTDPGLSVPSSRTIPSSHHPIIPSSSQPASQPALHIHIHIHIHPPHPSIHPSIHPSHPIPSRQSTQTSVPLHHRTYIHTYMRPTYYIHAHPPIHPLTHPLTPNRTLTLHLKTSQFTNPPIHQFANH